MADIIQLLPDHVANQIAAGEVVQRPASVVKELLENAIDAGATHIQLIVKDAGKTLIQVVDNGKGMSETDARLSFSRHATSKIRAAEDLFQLDTKGFRGEALASIGAIAHVEMNTSDNDDMVGTQIRMEGGKLVSQEVTATKRGTSMQVKNLFFNIPARRNFLKSNAVELRHIIDEFHRVVLAHPAIAFDFYNNGSELFKLPTANIRQRIVHVFGNKTNERLVPVSEETGVVNISGFVFKPEFSKKTRGEQFFFVNDRFIKSSYLHHAVGAAFEGLIKEQTHPGYFLFLEVDPSKLDINIHPTKTEIKFDDEHTIYAIIRSAVKHSLGQFNVAPVLDFDRDANLDTPYQYNKMSTATTPTIEVDSSFNPFEDEPKVTGNASSSSSGGSSSYSGGGASGHAYPKRERSGSWESLYVGLDEEKESFSSIEVESEQVTGSLFEEDSESASTTTYQLHKKYIVTTIKSGLVIIDQRRAHQRVLYEEFLKNMTVQSGASQQLLFPIKLSLNPTEMSLLLELQQSLESTGFVFSALDGEAVEISGVPVNVSEGDAAVVLDQLLSDLQEELPEHAFSQSDMLARTLCKSLAVRSGEYLNQASMQALVNNLFATKQPDISPFNKPTYITMTVDEIDKRFL
ncbi:DNA mismatch repair endonuclease MutL [Robertkochia sediminum]|uniref:DNA mismatch repair endonuclease MutL n=1 Tax=Robertkochia sediminum TaxID=2785326 RepID=UPI001933CB52|nr:DNA mismatch repair endonuclease MutL [Robertkochia sediminum]MBL7472161.1 DNA mismatch repair endonuclease MutL [Robertkochia sediminum]